MNGLEHEFERFRKVCLQDASDEETANVRSIFMAGALAASARILDFLDSDLPPARKHALLRRVARECAAMQRQVIHEGQDV
jgi:hypothetical protein